MKILLGHNYYQHAGGEDRAFHADIDLLRRHGHEVIEYTENNAAIERQRGSVGLALTTVWSVRTHRRLNRILRAYRPDVAHFHNTFPLISPSAYYACQQAGVPVVQTLHNYRLICPGATLYRDGHVCQDCLGRSFAWPGILRGCYRQSTPATAVVALMSTAHRSMRTWQRLVARYIVPTEFARSTLLEGGLRPESVLVRPNFVDPDPGPGEHRGGFVLYVGRLVPEKGLDTLLHAAERFRGRRLKIVGDGPLAGMVQDATLRSPDIQWLGPRPTVEVGELMGAAIALLFPSEWYETFGLVVLEALARGTPVVAADLGGIRELVEPGRTGLLFPPGKPDQLAERVRWAFEHQAELAVMGQAGRRMYLARYAAESAYRSLMAIYHGVMRPVDSRMIPGVVDVPS